MWSFFLNPVVQEVGVFAAFVACLSAILSIREEGLERDSRTPRFNPLRDFWAEFEFLPRRRPQSAQAPRRGACADASVEIWTDSRGETQGRARRGPCRGMRLDQMSREDCEAQAAYCREHDPQTAAALEAFVRSRFARRRREPPPRADGAPTRAQALAELGLNEGASEKEIQAAYRKLIKAYHPDHGGSHAKAARINEAKRALAG